MSSLKKKILVVDDETIQRQLLLNILQSVPHYQVIEADNGLSALETLKKERVDLIILDVMMPDMDGFETLAAIRQDAELAHIPVIMCTAVNKQEKVVRILQQGVAGYIVKPVKRKFVLSKVQRALAIVDDASDVKVTSESYQKQFTTDAYSVLIAAEDEHFRRIVRSILSSYYDIIEAGDESELERLSLDKQPQVILLGRLSGTEIASLPPHFVRGGVSPQPSALNFESFLSKLNPLIQGGKTKVYRIYSTGNEIIAERGLKYHGRMIRTLDINLLRSRFHDIGVLPDFTISRRKSVVVVALKNYYPQTDAERRMLLWAISVALDSDAQTVRFDLSDWESEWESEAPAKFNGRDKPLGEDSEANETNVQNAASEAEPKSAVHEDNPLAPTTPLPPLIRGNKGEAERSEHFNEANMQKVASRYIEDIITEFKSLFLSIEIIGYTPPEGSPLAALLTDRLVELQQEYVDYLTSQVTWLQQYCKQNDVGAITASGQKLNNFGKEHGFPQIALLADMLIRESSNNHWNVVEVLIEQLSREQKNMRRLEGKIWIDD